MTLTHISRFSTRSYEVDPYAHLNNGVYLSWNEQGRLDWLNALGYSYDGFAARKEWFVVGRVEIDFRAPLHLGDEVALETEVERLGNSSVVFRQRMIRQGDGVLASETKTVMVFSGEGGGSIPIPTDFRAAVEAS